MKYRKFGRVNWTVSEIGYGMWGMGGWTGSNDVESRKSLDRALELGCNFFDTAWAYGEGHSEQLLGELVRANPSNQIFVATKIPPRNMQWPSRRDYRLDECFPPDHIEEYIHRSLKALGLDRIDLIQFHTWEDNWIKDDRWRRKLDEIKKRGLVQAVGISINRWEPWNGVQAVRTGLVDSVQVIYNIFDQNPEDELFPACKEMNVAVIARVPFDEGSLIGNLTKSTRWPEGDWRNTYFVPENLSATVDRVEAIKPILPSEMILPEVALRFILMSSTVSTIIPGMRKLRNVAANMAASDAGPLDRALYIQLRKHRWDRNPTSWSQ
jgi:aryl-alcohol dehydrogenase-like predicted oxidoreductase